MPATQRQTNGESPQDHSGADGSQGTAPSVNDCLEMALEAAAEQDMSTSELMGIFFYYAHSIAENYRQEVMADNQVG